jgi:hypothetical protein
MIICYLRSSSWGTYDMCEQKYYMNYVLGKPDKDNAKAVMGTAVHKNMEVLAKIKLANRNGERVVLDDELGEIDVDIELPDLHDRVFDKYDAEYPGLMDKEGNPRKKTLEWTNKALEYQNGSYNPENQDIEAVEEFFDFEIKQDWAKYEYEIDGEKLTGSLRLRGTVDLILKEDDFYYHICDYKTGRRWCWATDQVKTYEKLCKDKQLRLYYYALRNKYPDRDFFVSIYYINDYKIDGKLVKGGVFTMAFDDEDYKQAENDIRKKFEEIRDNDRPKLLSNTCSHWKCKYLCAYSQIDPEIDPEKPMCMAIREQIVELGIDSVTAKHGDLSKLNVYTGGGKSNVKVT